MVACSGRRRRVLVLSWTYPTSAVPQGGLCAERMSEGGLGGRRHHGCRAGAVVTPLVPVDSIARFRRVPRLERRGDVDVYWCVSKARSSYPDVRPSTLSKRPLLALARRLHRERPFRTRARIVGPFGWQAWSARALSLYDQVASRGVTGRAP